MNTIAIIIVGMFIGNIIYGYFSETRRVRITRELTEQLDKTFTTLAASLNGEFKDLHELQNATLKEIKSWKPKPANSRRVYAVVLSRGSETRLFVNPSETYEQMIAVAMREFGSGWFVSGSSYVDIGYDGVGIPIAKEPKAKVESPSLTTFLAILEYSRDKFADKVSEKKSIDAIIRKIKESYGTRSTAGSSGTSA